MPASSLAPRLATAATQLQEQTQTKFCRAHLDRTSTVSFVLSWWFALPWKPCSHDWPKGTRRCCTCNGSSTRSRHACCTALLHSRQGCRPNPRQSTSSLRIASRHKCKGDQVQSPPCVYQTHDPNSPLTTNHGHSSELFITSWIFPTVAHLRSSSFSWRSRILDKYLHHSRERSAEGFQTLLPDDVAIFHQVILVLSCLSLLPWTLDRICF